MHLNVLLLSTIDSSALECYCYLPYIAVHLNVLLLSTVDRNVLNVLLLTTVDSSTLKCVTAIYHR